MKTDDSYDDDVTPDSVDDFIRLSSDAPPVSVPHGYVGPVFMPSTGRQVWWTGRVAIGLRHQPERHVEEAVSQSAHWLQHLVLGKGWLRPVLGGSH